MTGAFDVDILEAPRFNWSHFSRADPAGLQAGVEYPILANTMPLLNPMPAAGIFIVFGILAAPALAQEKSCLELIQPLEKQKMAVSPLGGLWSLFEQSQQLREHSMHAMQLDSRANKLLFNLKHLCKTLNGIPLNDLALYVNSNLVKKGEAQFRKELGILGKSQSEIDIWFKFTRYATAQQDRTLDAQSVYQTISDSQTYIERYVDFARKVQSSPQAKQASQAQQMIQELDRFMETDANMAQALFEKSQVPYWDFDENHGGS